MHPLPDPLDERVAAQVVARLPLPRQLLLDHALRRDSGVVHARQPERRIAQHAMPAHQRVLDRERDRVAQVQCARHVGRRHDDRERFARLSARTCRILRRRREPAALFPKAVDRLFVRLRVIGGRQLGVGLGCAHELLQILRRAQSRGGAGIRCRRSVGSFGPDRRGCNRGRRT